MFVFMFAFSLLSLFISLIEGENFWKRAHKLTWGIFGPATLLLPIIFMWLSVRLSKNPEKIKIKVYFCFLFLIFCSTASFIFTQSFIDISNYIKGLSQLYLTGENKLSSGMMSGIIGIPLLFTAGRTGAKIVIVILLFAGILLVTDTSLISFFRSIKEKTGALRFYVKKFSEKRKQNFDVDILQNPILKNKKQKKIISAEEIMPFSAFNLVKNKDNKNQKSPVSIDIELDKAAYSGQKNRDFYVFPPIKLLDETEKVSQQDVAQELQTNGHMLVETLNDFNVQTRIVNICRGPAVTRYELQPAAGVKISKITNLADDIALNLAASGVRIEAPIPGKAAVGVEIPNKIINSVRMRELVLSAEFSTQKSKLTVILGKDITGNTITADLAKMPHLLIAGSTGSGKSVCLNSFLISLLYKASPMEVRFLMIDPKVVELGIYNGIPHLLVPVVTAPRKASGALTWAVSEMLKRYQMFAENNVRDLSSYNEIIKNKIKKNKKNIKLEKKEKDEDKFLPQIVIVIDELADLMMVAPREVEDSICRLAQMARAAGMHLVIATQRPSVDVITGIIKANIPSRIALAVSSQIDSRTILDSVGAEKLLGRGDMLFAPVGAQKPIRIQGCYVADKEIESVVEFIKTPDKNKYDEKIISEIEKNAVLETTKGSDNNNKKEDNEDPMLQQAIKCVVEFEQASASLLQRKLSIGYARAGRLIDQMEKKGIVGPSEGSKSRKVFISRQEFLEKSLS
ncbi:MAG: DNA translocase FtsK [Oscillospiraceae bacterium]|nr:DNA translocase FtsK [Oscillospiraceae bacterium]